MHIGAAGGLVQMSTPDVARYYADELKAGRRFANACQNRPVATYS
jgi:hypothetical protein